MGFVYGALGSPRPSLGVKRRNEEEFGERWGGKQGLLVRVRRGYDVWGAVERGERANRFDGPRGRARRNGRERI